MNSHSMSLFKGLHKELIFNIFSKLSLTEIVKLRLLQKDTCNKINTYLINELQVKQIACGLFHYVILLKNGRVLVMGKNNQGQLGLGKNIQNVTLPHEIQHIDKIKQIETGNLQTYLLTEAGNVLVMGDNSSKQLGFDSAIQNIFEPEPIPGIRHAQFITAHDNAAAILIKSNDENNEIKLLGHSDYLTPLYLNNKIKLFFKGLDLPEVSIKNISIGKDFILLLSQENDVYGFGKNLNGNLGIKIDYLDTWTKLFDIKAIEIKATDLGSLILTTNNQLIVSGLDHGQFGLKEEYEVGFDIEKLIINPPEKINTQEKIVDMASNNVTTLLLTDKNEILAIQKDSKDNKLKDKHTNTLKQGMKTIDGFFKLKSHLQFSETPTINETYKKCL